MVVMEVGQLTGYSAVDLSSVRHQVGNGLKRVEDEGDKMVLYFDEVCTTSLLHAGLRVKPGEVLGQTLHKATRL